MSETIAVALRACEETASPFLARNPLIHCLPCLGARSVPIRRQERAEKQVGSGKAHTLPHSAVPEEGVAGLRGVKSRRRARGARAARWRAPPTSHRTKDKNSVNSNRFLGRSVESLYVHSANESQEHEPTEPHHPQTEPSSGLSVGTAPMPSPVTRLH